MENSLTKSKDHPLDNDNIFSYILLHLFFVKYLKIYDVTNIENIVWRYKPFYNFHANSFYYFHIEEKSTARK